MNIPDFVKAKAFWEALTAMLSGLLALLAFFGVIDPSWAIPSAVMLTWIFAILRFFGITPELKARLLETKLKRVETLLQEAAVIRNDLLGAKREAQAKKTSRA